MGINHHGLDKSNCMFCKCNSLSLNEETIEAHFKPVISFFKFVHRLKQISVLFAFKLCALVLLLGPE